MARKRGNNEGSIRQRPAGTWEGRYTDAGGNRRSVYAKTRAEAAAKLREALQSIAQGNYIEPSRITYGVWLLDWLDTYQRPHVRDKTLEVHAANIHNHILPALGQIPLQKLRAEHLQRFINDMSARVSPATVRKIAEPLRQSLRQAYRNKLIASNPAEFMQLPQADARDVQFLSFEQQRVLLLGLPDTHYGDAIKFILYTGLRVSELCGLQWGDISDEAFFARRGVQYLYGKYRPASGDAWRVYPPKTKAGKRAIPLMPETCMLLDAQKRRQMVQRLHAGGAWVGADAGRGECWVFTNELGAPMDRANIARVLRDTLRKAGLPSCGVHVLRHSFATNCVRAGVDLRTLTEIVGHTHVAFTLQQYVHSDADAKRAALEAVARQAAQDV